MEIEVVPLASCVAELLHVTASVCVAKPSHAPPLDQGVRSLPTPIPRIAVI
jgi:hypothetical protein